MDHYELGKVLGQGTYGTCHLARHIAENEWYALKRIQLRNAKDADAAQKEAAVRNPD